MQYTLRDALNLVLVAAFLLWFYTQLLQNPSQTNARFAETLVSVAIVLGGLLGLLGRGTTQVFGLTLLSSVLMVGYLQSVECRMRFGLPPVTDYLAKRFLFKDPMFRPGRPGSKEYRVMSDGSMLMAQRGANGYIGSTMYLETNLALRRGIDSQAIARYPDIGAFIVASRDFFSIATGLLLALISTRVIASSALMQRDKTNKGMNSESSSPSNSLRMQARRPRYAWQLRPER